MGIALDAAGIAPVNRGACRIHMLPTPCAKCDDIFNRAEALRRQQNQARAKRLHSEYLAKRSRKGAK